MSQVNSAKKKSLLEEKIKWENDIHLYQKFLNGDIQTFEAKFGAEEYISLAKNRIEAIDSKLKKLI
tara:strand:- start:1203 stop:1400 length:198 start_codon:yes stop_codon:yes gene_type:complete